MLLILLSYLTKMPFPAIYAVKVAKKNEICKYFPIKSAKNISFREN